MSEQPEGTPAAIVIRFDADQDGLSSRRIMLAFQEALGGDVKGEAWVCIKGSLDTLNETLTELGWPPREAS